MRKMKIRHCTAKFLLNPKVNIFLAMMIVTRKKILRDLREKYEIDVVFENKEFRLIGMPLFNEKKKEQFEKEFNPNKSFKG